MGILGPLSKTYYGKTFVMVMKDHYWQPKTAVPTSDMTVTHIASTSMDHWMLLFGVSDYVVADNERKFFNIFFEPLCTFLKPKPLTTTVYHPVTIMQA